MKFDPASPLHFFWEEQHELWQHNNHNVITPAGKRTSSQRAKSEHAFDTRVRR
jgi:hypothetical protein